MQLCESQFVMNSTFIRFISLILCFTIFSACSTVSISYPKDHIPVDEALKWNENVKLKKVDIYLKDGRILKDRTTRIRSKELVYVENDDYKSLDLIFVKEVHIKPQITFSFYLGLALIGMASYFFVDHLQTEKNKFGAEAGGVLVPFGLGIGGGFFIYQGLETQTTILTFDEKPPNK